MDAVRHRFAQLQHGAHHDVRSLVVPGLAVVPHKDNTAGDDGLRRGVNYRVIVDRESLAEPGLVENLRRAASRRARRSGWWNGSRSR